MRKVKNQSPARDITLIQNALNSSHPVVYFKYPKHYHNTRKKISTSEVKNFAKNIRNDTIF